MYTNTEQYLYRIHAEFQPKHFFCLYLSRERLTFCDVDGVLLWPGPKQAIERKWCFTINNLTSHHQLYHQIIHMQLV